MGGSNLAQGQTN